MEIVSKPPNQCCYIYNLILTLETVDGDATVYSAELNV